MLSLLGFHDNIHPRWPAQGFVLNGTELRKTCKGRPTLTRKDVVCKDTVIDAICTKGTKDLLDVVHQKANAKYEKRTEMIFGKIVNGRTVEARYDVDSNIARAMHYTVNVPSNNPKLAGHLHCDCSPLRRGQGDLGESK